MSVSFVQAAAGQGYTSTTIAKAFASNVTAGNCIAVYVSWMNQDITCTVADNINGAYTASGSSYDGASGTGYLHGYCFYKANSAGGACTVTATFSGSANNRVIHIHEISGCDTTSPLDADSMRFLVDPGTGEDDVVSTAVSPSVDGCYIFACNKSVYATTEGTGFTNAATTVWSQSEYYIQNSATAIAAIFTSNGGIYDDFIIGVMAFKPPSAAGGLSIPLIANGFMEGGFRVMNGGIN